jgi:tape measure domain-containing protein
MAGAYIGVQTVGSLINTADSLAANEARLNLMVKEGETAQQISDEIYAAAMRSRSGYMAMADSVAKVGIQAGNLFSNSSEMVRFMETFNKMAVISKANNQQTNAAMTQLIQALSFGQLRGDELKSILENMPMVAHALADELTRMGDSFFDTLPDKLKHIAADGKVTADEIRALGYEGQLSSETVVNAMLNGSEKIDKMAKNMTWTWGQVWEVFKNAALRAFTPIFNGISKIIQTERFKRFAEWVDGAMTRVANAAKDLWSTASPIIADIFDGIGKIGNFISDNWSFIAPIIWGIVGALTAYSVAVKIATIWTAIHKGTVFLAGIATAIFTKLTMAERVAKMKATAAQWGFNAAVYACPVTWIIVALIALIVIIYLVVAAINEMTGASISATGIICGAVRWLGSVIWDIIAWLINVIIGSIFALAVIIANIVIGIMNVISGVVQVIVNSCQWCYDNIGIIFDNIGIWWTNMWANCYIFFCDFITKVINKLASLAEYVQPIAEVLGMDIAGKLNKIKKGFSDVRDVFASQKKEYKSLKSFKDVNWTSVDYLSVGDAWDTGYNMLGYLDAGKAWDKGYDWGKGVENKFNGLMSGKSLDDLSKVGDLDKKLKQGDFSKALGGGFDDPKTGNGAKDVRNPALDKIGKNTDKIADSTGQTAENTSKDDEYFKYLRRAGERHSMNRQQLLNFKVDMSNVNHIKSGLDYDEMMKRLARELYQQVVSKMDGAISY